MSSLLPILALLATAAQTPQDYIELNDNGAPYMFTTDDPSLGIYQTPPGSGYDGVVFLEIEKPGETFWCTGALVGAARSNVLTAAHCLHDASSVDVKFYTSTSGVPWDGGPADIVMTTSSWAINSEYTGANYRDPYDIAVVNLESAVTGVDSYELFTGDAVGQEFNMVGFGYSGTGAGGPEDLAGKRLQGYNRFDFTGADPIFESAVGFDPNDLPWFGGDDILFADFDNGNEDNDASCILTSYFTWPNDDYCDTGLGDDEAMFTRKDSGSPALIDGRIAAVASFGLTYDNQATGDVDLDLNTSFGEFGGWVPVAPHAVWLEQQLGYQHQVVPEPATLILLLTGFLGVALVQVRRRKDVA